MATGWHLGSAVSAEWMPSAECCVPPSNGTLSLASHGPQVSYIAHPKKSGKKKHLTLSRSCTLVPTPLLATCCDFDRPFPPLGLSFLISTKKRLWT